jgi:hypothetical protein
LEPEPLGELGEFEPHPAVASAHVTAASVISILWPSRLAIAAFVKDGR